MLAYEVGRAHRHHYDFGLMLLDFDNFKLINDQFGHAFGDEVLQQFALAAKNALREGDIFARYGGDEFCVIFPETGFAEVQELAHKVLDATHGIELLAPSGQPVHITCSIGISMYPDHAHDKEDLFMVADNMLYRAKGSGKNAISYPQEADLVEVYKESNDQSLFIMKALETGEPIEPNYQPIVSMETGEIEVHELLMRLRQDDELISAGRFIETAEHMGLVNQMDMILIDKALADANRSGYEGVLFINLSPKAIVASEFIQRIQDLTESYQIDHERIVFEITERETVHNVALLEKFVRELRSEGFRFAIDDFGSGFSSFQYLKRFPVDFIKIEGEFINNMSKNEIDLAFVESAVSMAKSLGIETIAEFIENEETLDLVKSLGIDYAQGYLLATPQPDFSKQLDADIKTRIQTL
jgi:diguanylate cyclase (GGDEF)-like protein